MARRKVAIDEIKWGTRQRLEYIELMAFYAGIITRSDIAKAFAISDAAATKDLNYRPGISIAEGLRRTYHVALLPLDGHAA